MLPCDSLYVAAACPLCIRDPRLKLLSTANELATNMRLYVNTWKDYGDTRQPGDAEAGLIKLGKAINFPHPTITLVIFLV